INIFADAVAPDELLVRAGNLLDHDPWDWVLAGGEDHTLLGTTMKDAPSGFRLIGDVTRGNGGALVTVAGAPAPYIPGWESLPDEASRTLTGNLLSKHRSITSARISTARIHSRRAMMSCVPLTSHPRTSKY